jgi:hypothetical protein
MMRFPPRLAWDLTRVLVAQKLFGVSRHPVAVRLDLAEFPVPDQADSFGRNNPSSGTFSANLQALETVRASAAPFVWMGGDAPLRHPHVGHIVRAFINRGKTVFVEMGGGRLRRRIHEFRPVSRLFLVLPLHGLEGARDSRAGQSGNFRATIESLRTAKLCGFHICVETAISEDMDISELRAIAEFISQLGIDGWIQTRPMQRPASNEKLEAARKLIPSTQWRNFSRLLLLDRNIGQQDLSALAADDALSDERSGTPQAGVAGGDFDNVKAPSFENETLSNRISEESSATEEGLRAL